VGAGGQLAATVVGLDPFRSCTVVVWYCTSARAAALTPVRVFSLICVPVRESALTWRPVSDFGFSRLGWIVFGLIRLPGSELRLICLPLIFPAA
jgi:hypothetical protein